jgi:phosphoribosylamine-glycine ligase
MSSSKGQVITGVNEVSHKYGNIVFHSGTAFSSEGELVTNGKYNMITYRKYLNKSLNNYNISQVEEFLSLSI